MFNIKSFADFKVSPTASDTDRAFLDVMREVRDLAESRFVNYSVYDYRTENPDVVHFLTYPMSWLSHYASHFYTAIDPILAFDYRRARHIDWREVFADGSQSAMLARLSEFGVGNEAVTIVSSAGGSAYGAMTLNFACEPTKWGRFKRKRLDKFRLHCEWLTEQYRRLYFCIPPDAKPLTTREQQVLERVARGHTDAQIAEAMGIAKWTVVSHIQGAKYKLGCVNRTAAVASAITLGLINLRKDG